MAKKESLEHRAPSKKDDPPREDHLVLWRSDAKEDNTHVKAEVHAPKTIAIWKFLVAALLDPRQIHLHAALGKMVVTAERTEEEKGTAVQKMIESLKADTPCLTLREFRPPFNGIALVDMSLKSRIFLCHRLSSAIEETGKFSSSPKFDWRLISSSQRITLHLMYTSDSWHSQFYFTKWVIG